MAAAPTRNGGKDDSTIRFGSIGSRRGSPGSEQQDLLYPLLELSPFSFLKNIQGDTTVIADCATPGGFGISGGGWSLGRRTDGTSESFLCPFGALDPCVGRHVQAT